MSNQFNDNSSTQPTRMDRRRVQTEKKNQIKKKHPLRKIITVFITMILLIGSAYTLRLLTQTKNALNGTYEAIPGKEISKKIANRESFSILLVGADTGGEGRTSRGNSDTMIIATVNPKKNKIQMFSIPRDTLASIKVPSSDSSYDKVTSTDGTVLQKINSAYNMGTEGLTMKTVEKQLNIPIDYYMRVNFASMQKIVDGIGGIDVDVPFTFVSHATGNQKFVKGRRHLNGYMTLIYSRMRHEDPEGDYGRQKRQRQVITAIVKKILSADTLTHYQKVLNSVSGSLKTDITYDDMTVLASDYRSSAKDMESDYVHGYSATIPYANYPSGLSVEIPSTKELQRVSNKIRKNLGLKKETLNSPITEQNELNIQNGFSFESGDSKQIYRIYSNGVKTLPYYI